MSLFGRQLRAAAMAIVLLASGCSSSKSPTTDPDQNEQLTVDVFEVGRALVACYQDNGIDSEQFEDGSILSDTKGTLSRAESRALSALCDQRLADDGIVMEVPTTDESRKRNYAALQALRECLIDEGYSIPELGSFESLAAGQGASLNPLEVVLHADGPYAVAEVRKKCSYP